MRSFRLLAVLASFAILPIPAGAAPVTLRFAGEVSDVIRPDPTRPPDDISWWTDLSAVSEGMPWLLTLTYDADADGAEGFLPNQRWYRNAISDATLFLGPFAYTAQTGDIWTNYGHPAVDFRDPVLHGEGMVQFWFYADAFSGPSGNPAIWEGGMIVSYNDLGAIDGDLPKLLDVAPVQGLLSQLYWHRVILGEGGAFYSERVAVEQLAPVPEPATLTLLGAGAAALLARRVRTRR